MKKFLPLFLFCFLPICFGLGVYFGYAQFSADAPTEKKIYIYIENKKDAVHFSTKSENVIFIGKNGENLQKSIKK